jgi:hypothetical protein
MPLTWLLDLMPQLGRSVVHQEGLELIRAYIKSLAR